MDLSCKIEGEHMSSICSDRTTRTAVERECVDVGSSVNADNSSLYCLSCVSLRTARCIMVCDFNEGMKTVRQGSTDNYGFK